MKKIQRKQTRDHITQMIRYEILSGSIKPGEELAQESIAEQLGLSRMPVREALQSLEQEGFLIRLPNRHMQVARLEPDHVSHIFRIIAVMAAELFSLVPASNGASLRAQAEKLAQPGDNARELEFHQALIAWVDNRYLEKVYLQFLEGYISYVILHLKKDAQESAQLLAELADSIGAGDQERITQTTLRYFLSLAEIMRHHLKECSDAEA